MRQLPFFSIYAAGHAENEREKPPKYALPFREARAGGAQNMRFTVVKVYGALPKSYLACSVFSFQSGESPDFHTFFQGENAMKKKIAFGIFAVAVVAGLCFLVYSDVLDGYEFIGTFWSVMPPVVAIVLALITKEVYSSLFRCLVSSCFFN